MRKMRLLTAILLLLAMTLQGAISPMAATFTDTAGTKYEEAVDVLYALEIVNGMDAENFAPDESLTRAEMTAIITRVLRMEDWEEERTPFLDVPEDHWAYYPITTAHSLGIINGVDSQNFMPDAPVTANQAIKMVVTLLGYQVQAEAEGGYPAGYILRAGQLDLLEGMETGETPLCRGDMARLIYRALDVPLMARLSFGDDADYIYKQTNDDTLLSTYMHITKRKGEITAGYVEEITVPSRTLRADEVAFEDGAIYTVGESDAALRVGEQVVLYAQRMDDNTETILTAVPKSDTVVVTSTQILGNTTREVFRYEDEQGKEEKVTTTGATVIVNGIPAPGYTAASLMPDTGSVKLIYTGSALKYILVEAYENYQVASVNRTDMKVGVGENRKGTTTVSFDDGISTTFVDTDGKTVTVDACAEGDILSVAESTKYRKAVLSKKKVEGVLTETSKDTVIIDENSYSIAKSFSEAPGFKLPDIGSSASFMLNMEGQIAGLLQEKNAGMLYGWLRSAGMTKGLSGRPQLKIFTQGGTMQVFDTTENVSLNGENKTAATLLPTGGNEIFDGTKANEQLVMYRVVEEKISVINTARDYTARLDDPSRLDTFSLDVKLNDKCQQLINDVPGLTINYFGGTKGTFGRDWMARKDDTVIFVLPGSEEDKDFSVKAGNSLTHYTDAGDLNLYKYMTMYDITEDLVISAIVWDRRGEGESKNEYPNQDASMAIITKNVLTVNEEGETVRKLSLISHSGTAFNRTVAEDFTVLFKEAATNIQEDPVAIMKDDVKTRPDTITVDQLNVGDVVQYESGTNSTFTKLSVLFRAQTPGDYEQKSYDGERWVTNKAVNYGARILTYGEVEKLSEYGAVAKVNLLKQGEYVKNSGYHPTADDEVSEKVSTVMIFPATILKCDREKGTVTTITKDDISAGDKALFISKTTTPRMLIVYK